MALMNGLQMNEELATSLFFSPETCYQTFGHFQQNKGYNLWQSNTVCNWKSPVRETGSWWVFLLQEPLDFHSIPQGNFFQSFLTKRGMGLSLFRTLPGATAHFDNAD